MDFCLPCFDHADVLDNGAFSPEMSSLGLWEWQANQMANYVQYLIDHDGFKPKCYCPCDPVNATYI